LPGRIGWQTVDLLAQIENTNYLDGFLRVIEAPSDRELEALYQNCLFTLFPSFYEGWGLPVTESLSFGRTVAAAYRASIPEAGGVFCDYFDPDNLHDAYRVVARLINDPAHRLSLEQLIEREFSPPSWADSAAVITSALTSIHSPTRGSG
jgi:glycosyltransferase involved in cell wall biosynthesis